MAKYPTISHTPKTISNSVAEAKRGLTHESAVPFPVPASNRLGVAGYTKDGDENRRLELLLDRLLHEMQLMPEPTTTPLQLAVVKGYYVKADGTKVEFAGGTISVTDATSDQKVYIDVPSNALAKGASWPATETDYVPIAIVDASGGEITQVKDARNYCAMRVHASASDLGTTTQTTLTIDSDNAGAEVDMGLRFNRGSSGGGEDAELRWVAASGLFRLLTQHSTATRAALDVAKLQVAGSDVIETDGAIVAAAVKAARLYTFGANGGTAYGLKLTPGAAPGAPSSGAHTAGELAVDFVGVLWACTVDGTPGTWQQVGKQDSTITISVSDASGSAANPIDFTIQAKDAFGNNLAQTVTLEIGLMDDANGLAFAANVTAVSTPTGSNRQITANKEYHVITDANGTAVVRVTNSIADQVFVLVKPSLKSGAMNCSDAGTGTWS